MDDLTRQLNELSDSELAYVFERSKTNKDAPAFQAAGVSRSAFYAWGTERRAELNELAQGLKRNRYFAVDRVLTEAAETAARRIVDLIDDDNPRVQLDAAREVLDRVLGKPTQRAEVDTTSRQDLTFVFGMVGDDYQPIDQLEGDETDGYAD